MNRRSFYVRACWDDEAQVFYSESDIKGLHIEAKNLEEFEDVMNATAAELIVRNHVSMQDVAHSSLLDLIPSIMWQRPAARACA